MVDTTVTPGTNLSSLNAPNGVTHPTIPGATTYSSPGEYIARQWDEKIAADQPFRDAEAMRLASINDMTPRTAVWSNRLPLTISGGAARVINESGIDVWAGPQTINVVSGIIWPLLQGKTSGELNKHTLEELNRAYTNGYKVEIDTAVEAVQEVGTEDAQRRNIHCSGVWGRDLFTNLRWPSAATFQTTQVGKQPSVPLIEAEFFQDMVLKMSEHPGLTFASPDDAANFQATLAEIRGLRAGKEALPSVTELQPETVQAASALERWQGRAAYYQSEPVVHHPTPQGGSFQVYSVNVPESVQYLHYNIVSNGLLWPAIHSKRLDHFGEFTPDELNSAYENGYKVVTRLANDGIRQLMDKGLIRHSDHMWVHDYQCVGIWGRDFFQHTPWPDVEFLQGCAIGEGAQQQPLLHLESFQQLVMEMAQYPILTMQTDRDVENFKATLSAVLELRREAGLEIPHHLQDREIYLTEDQVAAFSADDRERMGIEAVQGADAKGPYRITVPAATQLSFSTYVGTSPVYNYTKAVEGEAQIKSIIDGNPDPKLTARDIKAIGGLFETAGPDRNIMLALHRDDYTKNTREKLEAIELFFQHNPDRVKDTCFALFVEPTRAGVPGYEEYQRENEAMARRLAKQYPGAVYYEPNGIKEHSLVLGLSRHPQVKAIMTLADKDGHDLTGREALEANDPNRDIAVITSNWIGSAELLGKHPKDSKGAFVVMDPNNPQAIADAFREVRKELDTPEGVKDIRERFDTMQELSFKHSGKKYGLQHRDAYLETVQFIPEDRIRAAIRWRQDQLRVYQAEVADAQGMHLEQKLMPRR